MAAVEMLRIAPILRRQRGADVRRQRDHEPFGALKQSAGTLNVARRQRIASAGVHEHVCRGAGEPDRVREVNAVVRTETQIRHDKVVWGFLQPRACVDETVDDVDGGES